jgi:hypothetical protein
MYNPFKPIETIRAEVFTSPPAKYRKKSRTAWSDANRCGEVECFLEGAAARRRQADLRLVVRRARQAAASPKPR